MEPVFLLQIKWYRYTVLGVLLVPEVGEKVLMNAKTTLSAGMLGSYLLASTV